MFQISPSHSNEWKGRIHALGLHPQGDEFAEAARAADEENPQHLSLNLPVQRHHASVPKPEGFSLTDIRCWCHEEFEIHLNVVSLLTVFTEQNETLVWQILFANEAIAFLENFHEQSCEEPVDSSYISTISTANRFLSQQLPDMLLEIMAEPSTKYSTNLCVKEWIVWFFAKYVPDCRPILALARKDNKLHDTYGYKYLLLSTECPEGDIVLEDGDKLTANLDSSIWKPTQQYLKYISGDVLDGLDSCDGWFALTSFAEDAHWALSDEKISAIVGRLACVVQSMASLTSVEFRERLCELFQT